MYGRLGSMYVLHLAEANAQRRRLALKSSTSRRPAKENAGMFLRSFGLIGLVFGVVTALSALSG